MAKLIDFDKLLGLKFNRLTILNEGDPHITTGGHKHRTAECICECGTKVKTQLGSILNGRTNSCGCYSREIASNRLYNKNIKHGMYGTPEYNCWISLRKRCLNEKHASYPDYGGRGIKICDRWLESFQNFLDDMGTKPSAKHSIDRINVNGNYEPLNCKWATRTEQSRNVRNNVKVTYNNETKCISEWASIYKIGWNALYYRIFVAKWSLDKAFNQPLESRKNG